MSLPYTQAYWLELHRQQVLSGLPLLWWHGFFGIWFCSVARVTDLPKESPESKVDEKRNHVHNVQVRQHAGMTDKAR